MLQVPSWRMQATRGAHDLTRQQVWSGRLPAISNSLGPSSPTDMATKEGCQLRHCGRYELGPILHADGGVDGEVDGTPVCSDNKLWDKMIYGLGDLDRAGE